MSRENSRRDNVIADEREKIEKEDSEPIDEDEKVRLGDRDIHYRYVL